MKNLITIVIVLITSLVFVSKSSKAQTCTTPWCVTGNNIIGLEYLGGDGTSIVPLRLRTVTAYPIEFYTHDVRFTTPPTRMVLTTGGQLGIGMAFTPTYKLDVDSGDINVNFISNGYRIGGSGTSASDYVLWHNGNISNIFVGVGAGMDPANTGSNNTFTGNDAGLANTTGANNTFAGFDAGSFNTVGHSNTFVGKEAGFFNVKAKYNTFIGLRAGYNNNIASSDQTDGYGDQNTFIGEGSGSKNEIGSRNTFVGVASGVDNLDGIGNTAIGYQAGEDISSGKHNSCMGYFSGDILEDGNYNTFMGDFAQTNTTNIENATAIGANAFVTQSNSLILGSIAGINPDFGHTVLSTNVGIGVTAPATRLEVRDASGTSPQLRLTYSLSPAIQSDFLTTAAGDLLVNPFNATTSKNVGINMTTTPLAKLHVSNTNERIGHLVITNRLTATTPNFGISTNSTGSDIGNIGVIATAKFSTTTVPNNLVNVGVFGNAKGNSLQNIGGLFVANDKTTCGTNYGVWGMADHNCDNSQAGYAGFFTGNVFATGTITPLSDRKLKDSIQSINGALAILSRLQPKQYVFRTDSFPSLNMATGTHYGIIAQEIDTVLPQLVANIIQPQLIDSSGAVVYDSIHFKGVNYMELIPFTIRAIQELDSLQGTKLTSCTGSPAANNLTKWDTVSHVLCSSVIYDDGTRIGIPTVDAHAFVNVVIASDTISAGRFEAGQQGVYGLANGNNDMQAGVIGESKNAGNTNVGVIGLAINATDSVNAGVLGDAENSNHFNVGGIYTSQSINTTAHNVAVYGIAAGSSNQNVGGRFEATDTVGVNYGLFATTGGSSTAGFAGYFDGDVHATGTVTWTSDQNLKTNVRNINSNDALASILKLAPKTYNYRTADFPYLNLAEGNQYGLLAQDVQQVLPELVSDITQPERLDKTGKQQSPKFEYKGLNYVGIIPVLIGALKQQQTKIDSLNTVINDRLNAMEDRLNQCCRPEGSRKTDDNEGNNTTPPANGSATQVNHVNVELSSMQVIVLEQNVPNPFAEQTSISYFVPENMNNAQIIFTDMLGTVIKTADIKTGYGVMTVFASNLSTGQYSYTLLVDGKTIETKKMVKSK